MTMVGSSKAVPTVTGDKAPRPCRWALGSLFKPPRPSPNLSFGEDAAGTRWRVPDRHFPPPKKKVQAMNQDWGGGLAHIGMFPTRNK